MASSSSKTTLLAPGRAALSSPRSAGANSLRRETSAPTVPAALRRRRYRSSRPPRTEPGRPSLVMSVGEHPEELAPAGANSNVSPFPRCLFHTLIKPILAPRTLTVTAIA